MRPPGFRLSPERRNGGGGNTVFIVYWDERLSTAAVTRTPLDANASRKHRSEVVDKMAAGYLFLLAPGK